MAGSSSVVVKVKYEDILRRFTIQIVDDRLNLSMAELRKKICSFFNFAPDADISLTYIDEDSDVVTLVNDDDLLDAVHQALNPLRITVKLNSDVNGKKQNDTNWKSAQDLRDVVSESFGVVPEPLRGILSEVSNDLASNLSSVRPETISELVNYFSKAGISFLGKYSGKHPNERDPSSTGGTPTQFSDFSDGFLKILSGAMTELSSKGKGKFQDETVGNMANSSGSGSGAVRAQNTDLPHPSDKVGEAGDKPSNVPLCGVAFGKDANEPTAPCWRNFPVNILPPLPVGSSNGFGPPLGCPFSDIPVNDESAAPAVQPWKPGFGNNSRCVHRGIRCDGCSVYPIAGPRYKSNVKHDYDLCSTCFDKMGNDTDYTRMEMPGVYLPRFPFRGFHDAYARHQAGLHHRFHRGFKARHGAGKLDSRFIVDVNVFDGTVMPPLTPFTKIWRMRNNGSLAWPPKTRLVWMGGDKLSHANSVEVEVPSAGLTVDHELDVAVDFISPGLPGRYVSYWRLASPLGQKFGQRVWVLIQVDASANDSPSGSVRNLNLNLNLPPLNPGDGLQVGPETGGTGQEEASVFNHSESDMPKKIVDFEEPLVDPKPNLNQELQFPINNILLVDDGASTSTPPSIKPSAPYPTIDLTEVASPSLSFEPNPSQPPAPSTIMVPIVTPSKPDEKLPENETLKSKIVEELDDMGFEHIDLNKEMLEYDMEQTVDQLYNTSWDPLLKELQEMGFQDKELNIKLLEKNNGSIQRVVLDLIASEIA